MAKKSNEEIEYDLLIANIRDLCKTKQGKDLIWYLLGFCELYSDTFTGNSQTYYNEGKRAVGLELLRLLEEADNTIYPRLILEKLED
jgi:hypothetical protein